MAMEYAFQPSPVVKFGQKLLPLYNLKNSRGWEFKSISELVVKISKLFSIRTALEGVYRHDPGPGHKNLNYTATTGLVVDF